MQKEFTQVEGINCNETFCPWPSLSQIQILLAIAAWQVDIKTAFLNEVLNEDVYVVQSDSIVDPEYAKKVCKLIKSIYGLNHLGTGT